MKDTQRLSALVAVGFGMSLMACGDDDGPSAASAMDASLGDAAPTTRATDGSTETQSEAGSETSTELDAGTEANPVAEADSGRGGSDAGDGGARQYPAAYPADGPLTILGVDRAGEFNEGAAVGARYHASTQQVFIVDESVSGVRVLSLDATGALSPAGELDPVGDVDEQLAAGETKAVAVGDELVVVTVTAQDPSVRGRLAFYEADGLAFLGSVEVGVRPTAVTFAPGREVVVAACSGEQERDGENRIVSDPPGSVAVVDFSAGVGAAQTHLMGFEAFDGRAAELTEKGVRLHTLDADYYAGGSRQFAVSRDLEPVAVAVASDGARAFVSLQPNNAFAVVSLPADVGAAEIVDVLPLGLKDHSRGQPDLRVFEVESLPALGTLPTDETPGAQVFTGGFAGMWYAPEESNQFGHIFYVVPDQGPTAALSDISAEIDGTERPHLLPEYGAIIQRLIYDVGYGGIYVDADDAMPLFRADGTTPITGKPNDPVLDPGESPVDALGEPLEYDPYGANFGGLLNDPSDGSWWMCDRYRPSIYNFTATGELIERFVPTGTATAASGSPPVGTFGTETLPVEYANRAPNRGFGAIAMDPEEQVVYAFMQSPMRTPDTSSSVIRVLGVDADKASESFGQPVHEYVYLLENPSHAVDPVDSIGDAVYVGNGRFLVIEHDASFETSSKKSVFQLDLRGATDLIAASHELAPGLTLEQHTPELLAAQGIEPLDKLKMLNLPSLGYMPGNKPSGIAQLADGRIALMNDNDFGLTRDAIPGDGSVTFAAERALPYLGLISFERGNGLDTSDEDEGINIDNWPVFGMYMPEALASYSVDEHIFFVSANRGATRGYDETRVADITLDEATFADGATLQQEANLGRLQCSALDGDVDGDGDVDRIHAFGGRSFSIWDEYGNLVWDSGDSLERVVAEALPEHFNADSLNNESFDTRSDAMGPQPGAIAVGDVGGEYYVFVGLESVGGIVIVNVSDPRRPELVGYVNARDFEAEIPGAAVGDLSPREIEFVHASVSPTARPLLIVANGVSGTTSVYQINL